MMVRFCLLLLLQIFLPGLLATNRDRKFIFEWRQRWEPRRPNFGSMFTLWYCPPPPPYLLESSSYMLFRLQNLDSRGVIWKIFRNKDLRVLIFFEAISSRLICQVPNLEDENPRNRLLSPRRHRDTEKSFFRLIGGSVLLFSS